MGDLAIDTGASTTNLNLTVAQRTFRRALNHLTIGNWITERDA